MECARDFCVFLLAWASQPRTAAWPAALTGVIDITRTAIPTAGLARSMPSTWRRCKDEAWGRLKIITNRPPALATVVEGVPDEFIGLIGRSAESIPKLPHVRRGGGPVIWMPRSTRKPGAVSKEIVRLFPREERPAYFQKSSR